MVHGVEDVPILMLDQLDALADRQCMQTQTPGMSLLGHDRGAIGREVVCWGVHSRAFVGSCGGGCAIEDSVRGPHGGANCARQIVRLGSTDAGCNAADRHRATPHWYGLAGDS
jgi:hypothetical protein